MESTPTSLDLKTLLESFGRISIADYYELCARKDRQGSFDLQRVELSETDQGYALEEMREAPGQESDHYVFAMALFDENTGMALRCSNGDAPCNDSSIRPMGAIYAPHGFETGNLVLMCMNGEVLGQDNLELGMEKTFEGVRGVSMAGKISCLERPAEYFRPAGFKI